MSGGRQYTRTREGPGLRADQKGGGSAGRRGPQPPLAPPLCSRPVGCLGTATALLYGLYCFHRGQSQRSQLMMRTRIAAQGLTVAAILLGLASSAMRSRS